MVWGQSLELRTLVRSKLGLYHRGNWTRPLVEKGSLSVFTVPPGHYPEVSCALLSLCQVLCNPEALDFPGSGVPSSPTRAAQDSEDSLLHCGEPPVINYLPAGHHFNINGF